MGRDELESVFPGTSSPANLPGPGGTAKQHLLFSIACVYIAWLCVNITNGPVFGPEGVSIAAGRTGEGTKPRTLPPPLPPSPRLRWTGRLRQASQRSAPPALSRAESYGERQISCSEGVSKPLIPAYFRLCPLSRNGGRRERKTRIEDGK